MCDACFAPDKEPIESAVTRAAKKLDKIKPGWENLIDTQTLDIFQCDKCVLGQVFEEEANREGYLTGYHLGMNRLWDQLFNGGTGVAFSDTRGHDQWVQEINARREAAQVPLKSDHALVA